MTTKTPYLLKKCPTLNSVPFFEKAKYIKKEHCLIFCNFAIVSLANVHRHYLRKYGSLIFENIVSSCKQ